MPEQPSNGRTDTGHQRAPRQAGRVARSVTAVRGRAVTREQRQIRMAERLVEISSVDLAIAAAMWGLADEMRLTEVLR